MTTVYVSIGNSDDKLSQVRWGEYVTEMVECVREQASAVYGEWYSLPHSSWQNACIAVEVPEQNVKILRKYLTLVRESFNQDSVAFAVAETEFI